DVVQQLPEQRPGARAVLDGILADQMAEPRAVSRFRFEVFDQRHAVIGPGDQDGAQRRRKDPERDDAASQVSETGLELGSRQCRAPPPRRRRVSGPQGSPARGITDGPPRASPRPRKKAPPPPRRGRRALPPPPPPAGREPPHDTSGPRGSSGWLRGGAVSVLE